MSKIPSNDDFCQCNMSSGLDVLDDDRNTCTNCGGKDGWQCDPENPINIAIEKMAEENRKRIREQDEKTSQLFKDLGLTELVDLPFKTADYITVASFSDSSVMYYPKFRILTIMGDGSPMARFVFSEDFSECASVFFSSWKENHKLHLMSNPDGVPYMFPRAELLTHLKKVKI